MKQGVRRRIAGAFVGGGIVVAALLLAFGASSQAARATLAAANAQPIGPKVCGQDVTYPKPNDTALTSLPASVQKWYQAYPYQVQPSPWATFKGKKKPFTIGYISFPIANPWKVNYLKELNKEFAAAKAKGIVSGSLREYIQPSSSTATPEQQSAAIAQMVRDGVDGILLHPLDSQAETPAIDAAGKAGVPVVLTGDTAPNSKYAVNVWTPNNLTGQAAFLAMLKARGVFSHGTVNAVEVRGIQGNTVEQTIHDAAVLQMKPCPIKVVGTVWGNWDPATTKTATLQFLASYPGKIDFVMQEDAVGAGVIEAFQEVGRPVPPQPLDGSSGGDFSWWLANKSTYKTIGITYGGAQAANTTFQLLLRILAGKGLKVRDVVPPGITITNSNIAQYATPGEPVTWLGDIRGAVTGWLSPTQMDNFFVKPGNAS